VESTENLFQPQQSDTIGLREVTSTTDASAVRDKLNFIDQNMHDEQSVGDFDRESEVTGNYSQLGTT
jgi:hypothetical protein